MKKLNTWRHTNKCVRWDSSVSKKSGLKTGGCGFNPYLVQWILKANKQNEEVKYVKRTFVSVCGIGGVVGQFPVWKALGPGSSPHCCGDTSVQSTALELRQWVSSRCFREIKWGGYGSENNFEYFIVEQRKNNKSNCCFTLVPPPVQRKVQHFTTLHDQAPQKCC